MSSHPSERQIEMAKAAARRLIEFYHSIAASNPETYAAGLVALFATYPEHLVAEAIDPVNGLPSQCEYLPTIAKVKAFLEPRRIEWQQYQDRLERFNRKRLPEPPRDPEESVRILDGYNKLIATLKSGMPPPWTHKNLDNKEKKR